MEDRIKCLENLFLGLADKTRLRLLGLMANGPVSVGFLVAETGESQPKVSRHLAYLRHVGLVDTQRDGKWIYYAVAEQESQECDAVLRSVLAELNGNGQKPRSRPVARPHRPSEPEPVIADSYYSDYSESEDQNFEAADEWDEGSDDRKDEIEIFLL